MKSDDDEAPCVSLARDDIGYWLRRIERPTYRDKDGRLVRSPHYSLCISFQKERHNISLSTGDLELGAARALRFWRDLNSGGWRRAFANLRPLAPVGTVGEFIAVVSGVLPKNPTSAGYVRSLRLVASEVAGVGREAADTVCLCDLTVERIEG